MLLAWATMQVLSMWVLYDQVLGVVWVLGFHADITRMGPMSNVKFKLACKYCQVRPLKSNMCFSLVCMHYKVGSQVQSTFKLHIRVLYGRVQCLVGVQVLGWHANITRVGFTILMLLLVGHTSIANLHSMHSVFIILACKHCKVQFLSCCIVITPIEGY